MKKKEKTKQVLVLSGLIFLILLGGIITINNILLSQNEFIKKQADTQNEDTSNQSLPKASANTISVITPEEKKYTKPMEGYYLGTYGFEDGDLSEWINPDSPLDIAEVVPEKGGHNGVLHLLNYNPGEILNKPEKPEPYFQNTFPSRTSGVVELWHFTDYHSGSDKWDHVIAFAGGQLYVDQHNRYIWWTNAAGKVVLATNVINKWNHIKFNLVNGILQISINNGTPIQVDSWTYINYIAFIEYWTREMWIDAIGYSWDPSYNVGDNKDEGLLLDFESSVTLPSMSYSLDSSTPIPIRGDTVIHFPEDGSHSIQVFGTDLAGNNYASDIVEFCINICKPSKPRELNCYPRGDYVYLNWIEPSDDGGDFVSTYHVYRRRQSGSFEKIGSTENVWYNDDSIDLEPIGDTYYYYIRAENNAGIGDSSNIKSIQILPDFVITRENIHFKTGVGETDVDATITNIGFNYMDDINISFYTYEANQSEVQHGTDQIISGLLYGEPKNVTVRWTPKLFHFIMVRIDPEESIPELNKTNNVEVRGGGGNSPTIVSVRSDYGKWIDTNILGTFLKPVKILNTFYADIDDLDGDMYYVEFEINGELYNGTREGNVWTFQDNMGDLNFSLPDLNVLKIKAYDILLLESEEIIINIKVVEIPSWITDITGDIPEDPEDAPWLELEIGYEGDIFIFINFTYPLSGDPVEQEGTLPDSGAPTIGGQKSKSGFKIEVIIIFSLLSGEATISGKGEYGFELLGYESKISITLTGEIIDFQLIQATITFEFSIKFPILGGSPLKTSILTIEAGLAAEFKIVIETILELEDNVLKWAKFTITTSGYLIGFLNAKIDLGFVGASFKANMRAGLEFTIGIENGEFFMGLDGKFSFDWRVTWKLLFIRGSFGGKYELTWHIFSPEDKNTTITEEPWTFTENYTNVMDSRPRVATDQDGNAMMVWTENRFDNNKVFTDIYYSIWDGTEWGVENHITYDEQPDFDPALTYDSNGNVMVVWSRTTGDMNMLSTEDPFELLKTQEIAYSIWNGTVWSTPQLITNDNYANGRAVVSAGKNGEIHVVWVGDSDYNFTTTGDMELYYSVWDGESWSNKEALTQNDYMDYSASLAYDSKGDAMVCWIRDTDNNRTTRNDRELLYATWDGTEWNQAAQVVDLNENKEMPSVNFDHDDNAVLAWVGGEENSTRLYYSSWSKSTREWSIPEIVHEDSFFIYYPAINIDPNNTAVIVWRGFEDNAEEMEYYLTHNATDTYFDGEICYAVKDLNRDDANWSEVKYLTSNNKTDWMASAVIIRGHSNDLLLVWDMDGVVTDLVHEIKPDLFVNSSDIFFSNEHPMEGEVISITSTIYNIGDVEAKDISVYFYNGDPKNGGYLIGTALIDLDYDKKINVTIPWVAQPGSNNIYVVIDHENLISELNETNNIAFKTIDILPDLALYLPDISFSNLNPSEGEDIIITATIYNYGGTKAEKFNISFYDDDNIIQSVEIELLNSTDYIEIPVMWTAKPGLNNITVIIDLENKIVEWNENNNNATATISVYPDLIILEFNVTDNILTFGEDAQFTVEIKNIGATSAHSILLEFYDGNPFVDGVLFETVTIPSLGKGQSTSFSFYWSNPSPGIHKVFAIIDYQNIIDECDETNNLLYQELMVLGLPDLAIGEPEFIYTLDYIEISTPIKNVGGGGAMGVVIDLYDGNPLANGKLIRSLLITYISAGQYEVASLKLDTIPTYENLYIIVDPMDILDELNENNNQLIIHYADIIKVDAGPDQQVEEGELVEFSAILYGGISGDFPVLWDFGDGSSGEGINPAHQYGDNGVYNVVLTVTGPNFIGIDELIVSVSNVAPIVDAGLDQTVNEDDTVSFSGTFSDPGIMDTHTFLWDFGDGSPTVTGTLSTSHVYAVPRTYIVSLTVTDDDGGTCTDLLVVTVLDITPPTTTLTFLGLYYISDYTYISSTATEIMLDAEDAEMPDGSGVDIIQYQIDTVTGSWVNYTGLFTIDLIGSHTLYYRSIDKARNIESPKSVDVVVNASELIYTGEVNGVYSDPVILNATLIDIATQLPIPGKTIVFTLGDQTASAVTLSDGVATVTVILDQPGGSYSVSASFTGDEEYLASSDIHAFTLEKEHVYAIYTGFTVVPTTADTITLRATVFDEDDGNWGDLTKIHVTFTIYDENYILSETHSLWVEITNIDGIGVAIIEILNNLNEGCYLVEISFDPSENDYYQGPDSDFVVLIIYEPTGDFVTGGGWIEDTEGNKGNFGFNIKYKKNGLPKGQAIYVYREGDFVFIVKANAWIGMAIDHGDNHAFFEAKCNIKQINSITGEVVWEKGNYRLRIDVWDHSKDGKNDVFQIRVYDKIGLVYHEAGFEPYGFLQGGNIVIHVDDKKK